MKPKKLASKENKCIYCELPLVTDDEKLSGECDRCLDEMVFDIDEGDSVIPSEYDDLMF